MTPLSRWYWFLQLESKPKEENFKTCTGLDNLEVLGSLEGFAMNMKRQHQKGSYKQVGEPRQ